MFIFRRAMWLITRTILFICSSYIELNEQLSTRNNLKYIWHSEVLVSSMIKLIYKKKINILLKEEMLLKTRFARFGNCMRLFAHPFPLFLRCTYAPAYFLSWYCVKSVCIWSYSGRHFPAFALNTKRYCASLHIQFEFGKIRKRIIPTADTFYAVTAYSAFYVR